MNGQGHNIDSLGRRINLLTRKIASLWRRINVFGSKFYLAGRKVYSLVPKINEPGVLGINYLGPQFNRDIELFGRKIGLLEQIINQI